MVQRDNPQDANFEKMPPYDQTSENKINAEVQENLNKASIRNAFEILQQMVLSRPHSKLEPEFINLPLSLLALKVRQAEEATKRETFAAKNSEEYFPSDNSRFRSMAFYTMIMLDD